MEALTEKELMEEIKKWKVRRDRLKDELSSIKGSIAYYRRKGNGRKVKKMLASLDAVKDEYEKAKKMVNYLYFLWRERCLR